MDQDDYETLLELTAQCQLMDLEELRAGIKGKSRVGGRLSDLELSYNVMEAEARATLQHIQDRRIARGARGASQEDVDLINTIAEIERQEQADRQYALALSTDPDALPPPSVATSTSASRSGFGSGSADRNSRDESPSGSSGSSWPWSTAESFVSSPASSSRSSLYEHPKPRASTSKATFIPSILRLPHGRSSVDCVICGDFTNQAYQAPCDRQCLTDLFDKATVDESLFPPRCCSQQISFAQIRSILSPQLVQKFETKSEEFKTTNRLYCHNSTCSRFLGPAASTEREKGARLCTQCWRTTCSFCKSAAHASHVPCETDTAAQQVLALGRQEGWQSCPSCHHMVELDTGCYHMTCRCRYEFCYVCARRWKECTCPQWDENLLVAQAERRVVRDLGALPAAPRPAQLEARQHDIFRMVEDLRVNHECDHHLSGFFRRGGSGNCESCGNWLRDFLLVSASNAEGAACEFVCVADGTGSDVRTDECQDAQRAGSTAKCKYYTKWDMEKHRNWFCDSASARQSQNPERSTVVKLVSSVLGHQGCYTPKMTDWYQRERPKIYQSDCKGVSQCIIAWADGYEYLVHGSNMDPTEHVQHSQLPLIAHTSYELCLLSGY